METFLLPMMLLRTLVASVESLMRCVTPTGSMTAISSMTRFTSRLARAVFTAVAFSSSVAISPESSTLPL